jgi:phosphatidylinositol glycan class C protein
MSAVNREHPPLWKQGHRKGYDRTATSAKELMKCYSSKPDPQPWSTLCESSLVVGQEFVLTCFFLARLRIAHQEETGSRTEPLSSQILSFVAVTLSLTLVAFFSNSNQGRRRQNAKTRLIDSFLLATLLRLLAAALKTLTASYSSDTVIALSVGGMIVHLLGCDYHYANGATPVGYSSSSPRPPFLGGTMSLNAAFFSTALLVSRLESNWTVHAFVSTSVTVFAFYPATRHGLFVKSPREAPFGKNQPSLWHEYEIVHIVLGLVVSQFSCTVA